MWSMADYNHHFADILGCTELLCIERLFQFLEHLRYVSLTYKLFSSFVQKHVFIAIFLSKQVNTLTCQYSKIKNKTVNLRQFAGTQGHLGMNNLWLTIQSRSQPLTTILISQLAVRAEWPCTLTDNQVWVENCILRSSNINASYRYCIFIQYSQKNNLLGIKETREKEKMKTMSL